MRTDETDQPPASDMAPMSGHTQPPGEPVMKAAHLPPEADQDAEAAVTLAENEPDARPGAESSSE